LNERSYSVFKSERLRRRRRRWVLLSVVGLAVVAGIVVGASYLWLYMQWQKTQIDDPTLSSVLASTPATNLFPPPEGTMNILVLGVESRGYESIRSDSMILVHADPAANYLSTLSLPRDLRVEVPGHGYRKLNWSYSKGGPTLAVQTVEANTNVDITHYLEVDFKAFTNLTDAVGGVYIDVDKHYFNDTKKYDQIDVRPGYQLLHGVDALDYVRYRMDNNMDFGRQHRQQTFLTALREQAMGWDLGFKLPGLIQALTDNIQTTISFDEIRNLAYWVLTKLDGGQIRQQTVSGAIQTVEGVSFVIPSEGVLEQKVADFMDPTPAATASQTTVATLTSDVDVPTTAGSTDMVVDSSQFMTDPNFVPDSALWSEIAAQMPFTVMAPGYLPQDYKYYQRNPEGSGGYDIDTGGGSAKGLKMVYRLVRNGTSYDQYLGIMETDWLDAPAASPGRQVVYNGTTFTIVGTYDRTERVWWEKDGVLYWVSNTISHYLNPTELVKVAASMITIPSGATP